MKGLFLKLGLITASIVLFCGVAFAKGPGLDHVTLEGPGIVDQLKLEEHYPYLLDDAIFMHVFGSATRADIAREDPDRGQLGPRFLLRYHMALGDPIEIDFYPYADQGPIAHAPPGQVASVPIGRSGEDREYLVHPGWYDYPPGMVDLLQEQGLPTAAEIDQGRRETLFVLVGLVLVTALALSASWRRRRLPARLATTTG